MQPLFIKIHNQVHVSSMLSHPQTAYSCVEMKCTVVSIILLKF